MVGRNVRAETRSVTRPHSFQLRTGVNLALENGSHFELPRSSHSNSDEYADQYCTDVSTEKVSASASPSAASASVVAPATSATPVSPSVEPLWQAGLAGYHVRKLRQGATIFCKNEAHVGNRFSTESCIDETQLAEFLIRAQSQRDELKKAQEQFYGS